MLLKCPNCESISTIPIIYGYPGDRLIAAISRNLATTGGCVIYDGGEQPTRECLDCNHSWDARLIKTALDFKTAASLPLLSQFILENLQYYGPHKADKTTEFLSMQLEEEVNQTEVEQILKRMEQAQLIHLDDDGMWHLA